MQGAVEISCNILMVKLQANDIYIAMLLSSVALYI